MKMFLKVFGGALALLVAAVLAGFFVLRSMDFNPYRGLIAEQVKMATGRELAIAGKLNLRISLTPSLTVENVRFANAPWGSRKDMIVLARLAAEVRLLPLLGGEVRINRLVLSGLDVLLEVDGQGRANWDMAPAETPRGQGATGQSAPAIPLVNKVLLRDIKLAYRDARDGFSFAATVQSFAWEAGDAGSPINVTLKAVFADVPMSASGRLGGLKALTEGGRYPVHFDVDAAGLKARAEGHIEDPRAAKGIDLRLGLKSDNLATTIAALRPAVPAAKGWNAPAVPLEATLHLKGQGKNYSLDGLKARVGGSDLSGGVRAAFGGRVPEFSGSLASARLDLNEIFPPAAGSATEPAGDGRVFSADPLPLEAMRAFNADLAAKIETAVLPGGIGVRNANARVVLKDGRLAIPLTFVAGGGSLKGDLTFDGTRPNTVIALRLDGAGIDGGQILSDAGLGEAVRDSRIEIAADLKGAGRSAREIMGSLDGEAKLVVGPGRMHNKVLDLAGGDLAGQVLGAVNPFAKTDEFSTLHCAVARFSVKGGVADARDGLALETGKMTVAGSGRVDFRDETLDLAFRPEARQGIGAGDVVGLVRITGTLAEPSVGIDPLETVMSALGAGASIVTLGLSETAKSLLGGGKSATTVSPCQVALGIKPQAQPQVPSSTRTQPAKPAKQPAQAPPAKGPAKEDEGVGGAIRGIGEGITKGLKGILGQ